MSFSQLYTSLYHRIYVFFHRIPVVPRNLFITVLFLVVAHIISTILIAHTGGENNSALVFVLAVVFISYLTTGYVYGIAASIVGAFCINYFFMFPYSAFSLSISGYPVAMLSMVAISCIVCTLTALIAMKLFNQYLHFLYKFIIYLKIELSEDFKSAI